MKIFFKYFYQHQWQIRIYLITQVFWKIGTHKMRVCLPLRCFFYFYFYFYLKKKVLRVSAFTLDMEGWVGIDLMSYWLREITHKWKRVNRNIYILKSVNMFGWAMKEEEEKTELWSRNSISCRNVFIWLTRGISYSLYWYINN